MVAKAMINSVYTNILSEDLLFSLQKTIDNELSKRTIKDIPANSDGYSGELDTDQFIRLEKGRIQLELFPIPREVMKAFSKVIKKDHGQHSLIGAVYCEYNTKYGEMSLPIHKDRNKDNLCFDYQISASIDWPIVIDNKKYSLDDNSAVTMWPKVQEHGRVIQNFEDGSFVKMLFTFWRKRGIEQ
jgi:hypothetical protein